MSINPLWLSELIAQLLPVSQIDSELVSAPGHALSLFMNVTIAPRDQNHRQPLEYFQIAGL